MAIFLLVFFLLLVAYRALISFYHRTWNRIPLVEADGPAATRVTVVVAVRDEESTLPQLIDCLASQRYPPDQYEVVIVDDHSSDGTAAILKNLPKGFRALALPGEAGSKKLAISAGVAAARGDLILATDADCTMGPEWIGTIAACQERTGAKLIAAPVRMQSNRSVLGLLQSLDFLVLQGITGASVYRGSHSMCNGANLAYWRQSFLEVGGFEGVDHIVSGDDMLLMHKIWLRDPQSVVYLRSQEAIVSTNAESGWRAFLHQRIRWASKAVHYRDRRIIYVLLLVYSVNLCFAVLAVAALVESRWLGFLLILFLAKILIEYPFVHSVSLFFGQQKRMRYFLLIQPLHIAYTLVAGWLGRFGSFRWKSRTYRRARPKII